MPSILEKIQPLGERSRYLKAVIYGQPGVGKTCLAASGPDCLVIDVERGTKSLLLDPSYQNVRILEPESFKDVDDLFWAIRNEKLTCQTLVLDSGSEFQRKHLDEITEAAAKKGGGSDPNRRFLATQPDYQLSTNMMRRHLLAFRELPLHFIVTAHVRENTDEMGKLSFRPDLTDRLAGIIISMMDLVGFLKIGEKGERVLQTTPSNRISAKNRLGLPAEIKDPKWSDLVGVLNQEKERETVGAH